MKHNDETQQRIEVVFESDINAFARIIDLLTMLSLVPNKLDLVKTAMGDYRLTLQLDTEQSNPLFAQRFWQKLGALDFVLAHAKVEQQR